LSEFAIERGLPTVFDIPRRAAAAISHATPAAAKIEQNPPH